MQAEGIQAEGVQGGRGEDCVITHSFGRLSWLMKLSCWCIGPPRGFQKKRCLV